MSFSAVGAVWLSAATSIVEGGVASSGVSLNLDVNAAGGAITCTPTASGITFNPTTVEVASGAKISSGTFTMIAAAATAAGETAISVALSGAATNKGSGPFTVTVNLLTVVDGAPFVANTK